MLLILTHTNKKVVIQICTAALVHCVAMLFMSGFGNSDVTFSCMIFKTVEYAP